LKIKKFEIPTLDVGIFFTLSDRRESNGFVSPEFLAKVGLHFFLKSCLIHTDIVETETIRRRPKRAMARRRREMKMIELLKTPLTDWHIANGAKMAEFAGYSMPINYPSGALKEIHAVRNFAGLFDISHMRPIFVEGTEARKFLDLIDTRDLSLMKVGDARYGIVCNENGEPLDDIIVYLLSEEKDSERFLVIANASNGTKIYEHLCRVKSENKFSRRTVTLADGLGFYGFVSLQGPKAEEILKKVPHNLIIPKKSYSCVTNVVRGYRFLIAKTGYTGEEGFEILCPKNATDHIWTSLLNVGKSSGLIPCGLASRDTLRLEAGMPLFGHEMDKEHDPISAGLPWAVNFGKMFFIGKDELLKVSNGTSKKSREYFHAFVMDKGRVPRHGDLIVQNIGGIEHKIGKLTSAGFSPTLGKNIAMGYLDCQRAIGLEVFIEIGGKLYPATVTERPFYKREKK
jgi:aminomethyltransferase